MGPVIAHPSPVMGDRMSTTTSSTPPAASPAADPTPPVAPAQGGDDPGFPANTPWRDMAPEQQVAYWRHQARKHEDAAKDRGTQLAQLQQAQMTEQELAIAAARDSGATEATRRMGARLAVAEFRAVSGGTVDADALSALRIDPAAYLTDDGEPDVDAIRAAVARLAPPAPAAPAGPIDTGGGGGSKEPSLASQISAATAAGDWALAQSLKSRQLAELMRQQH